MAAAGAEAEYSNPLDPEQLGEENRAKLEQFHERMNGRNEFPNCSLIKDRHYLMFFLAGRKFDVDGAEKMLRNHLKARAALRLDDYVDNFEDDANYPIDPVRLRTFIRRIYEMMRIHFPQGVFGHDKWGRLITYHGFGKFEGVHLASRDERMQRTVPYLCDRMAKLSLYRQTQKIGRLINQGVYIMDLDGINFTQLATPAMDIFVTFCKLFEQHGPEYMHKIFVINAPSFFPMIWSMCKHVVDEHTRTKLYVFGSDGYQAELLKHIDADQLPVHYGGTATQDGDPKCSKTIVYGGKVPTELYFNEEKRIELLPKDTVLKTVTVAAGNQTLIRVSCDIDNAVICWYLQSGRNVNIEYCMYEVPVGLQQLNDDELLKRADELPWLSLKAKCYFGYVPEFGHLPITRGQQYAFHLDNSASWLTSKSFKTHVAVLAKHSDRLHEYGIMKYDP